MIITLPSVKVTARAADVDEHASSVNPGSRRRPRIIHIFHISAQDTPALSNVLHYRSMNRLLQTFSKDSQER